MITAKANIFDPIYDEKNRTVDRNWRYAPFATVGTYPNNLGSFFRLDLLWSNTRSVEVIAKPAVRREMMSETYISG